LFSSNGVFLCRYAAEDAFAQLAQGKVDVPLPMHIGGAVQVASSWTQRLKPPGFFNP
jgi:hypothetical protein